MLLYQAEGRFVYGIDLESLKNAFPEVCWGFRMLAGGCLGAFWFCLFRIELAFVLL